MEQEITTKRTIIFCVITFGLTWLLAALIPIMGFVYGGLESLIIVTLCMFMPALGNILTRVITRQGFHDFKLAPKFKGNGRNYLFAYFSFIVLVYLGVLVYYLIYREQFDLTALIMWSPDSTEYNMQFIQIINLVVSTVISPIINVIPTLGEELGWRGYLLYGLKNSSGSSMKAVLITGVIWGIWHAPMIAMGHNYGTGYPGYPYIGILMMIVFCVLVGIIEGYITLRTDSVLPAAICHSAINGLGSIGILFCNTTEYRMLIGPVYAGIIPLIPTILFAAYILYKIKKEAI
ncbi:MAG: CPBP family intramembrane metalloprotease [Lachnospiraceae bacterium]|nr:CPBP family intramembrane metalloprotease [Lachnospiraceae bacterium]